MRPGESKHPDRAVRSQKQQIVRGLKDLGARVHKSSEAYEVSETARSGRAVKSSENLRMLRVQMAMGSEA
jgi:hypothetical protein